MVREIRETEHYIGLSTDEKRTNVPVGSTFRERDTGRKFVSNGTDWDEDFDALLLEAVEELLTPLMAGIDKPCECSGEQTADALLVTGSGVLKDVLINTDGTNNAALILYDGTSSAGKVVWKGSVLGDSITGYTKINRTFHYGLYADMTVAAGAMSYNVGYDMD